MYPTRRDERIARIRKRRWVLVYEALLIIAMTGAIIVMLGYLLNG